MIVLMTAFHAFIVLAACAIGILSLFSEEV